MSAGALNSPLEFVHLFLLSHSPERSQEMLKNLSKTLEKHLERDSGYCPCGKLDIGFITLWDYPVPGGSVTIINIFELFKQTALIAADKICAGRDDCKECERRN